MQTVTIPITLVNQLLHHAQRGDKNEICGLISSIDDKPFRSYPISNTADTQQNRYNMDPKEQIDAMRLMRERDETLFAIYHSHPSSPAEPSAIDITEAGYPDALYLIISLKTKGVLEMRGFRIIENMVTEVTLVL